MASTPCYCNTQKQQGFNVSHSLLSLYILLILWHVHRPCVRSSHDACTTPVSAGHVRAHVSYMCGGMWRVETKHTPSSERVTDDHLGFHTLSFCLTFASFSPVRTEPCPTRRRAGKVYQTGRLSEQSGS